MLLQEIEEQVMIYPTPILISFLCHRWLNFLPAKLQMGASTVQWHCHRQSPLSAVSDV